ncbi:sensor domain-containing diguanylate cyclase [Starkeya sp. 3C]|uniref:Sensor domain-containing diguanylate cyclase n=1 Tax=Ancylobacter moscoviensis TaxID=2597768 RepID=A0ABY3DWS9_9HYPH|nr:sensor domain-containing diguanylate cyclase [Ancylobacter moscoviensis]TSJ64630.1 sensor domain-containing diguanylate cyclase [Ancylobacter moscoviensis]
MLDAMPIPLSWATIPSGEIVFCNRAFVRYFGYSASELSTVDNWIDSFYIYESERAVARSSWKERWLAASSGVDEIDDIELHIRCSDGKVVTALHRGIILHELGIGIAIFEDITARKIAEERARHIALEDALTGLRNRRALQAQWDTEHLVSDDAARSRAALLLLDIDGFKQINDRYGHNVGDEVLVGFADRLREGVRNDCIYRYGGDEFVIYASKLKDAEIFVSSVCERILSLMRPPIQSTSGPIDVRCTIGASVFPENATELKGLIERADEALYRRKRIRKGTWGLYGQD